MESVVVYPEIGICELFVPQQELVVFYPVFGSCKSYFLAPHAEFMVFYPVSGSYKSYFHPLAEVTFVVHPG